jgi:hypothetical protein
MLAMAMMQGLTSAIVNPNDQRLMETLKTCDIIKNNNLYADSYLEICSYRRRKKCASPGIAPRRHPGRSLFLDDGIFETHSCRLLRRCHILYIPFFLNCLYFSDLINLCHPLRRAIYVCLSIASFGVGSILRIRFRLSKALTQS